MAGRDEIEQSKTKRGQKLFAASMKELHRRGVTPVKGELKNKMREAVAKKMAADAYLFSSEVFPRRALLLPSCRVLDSALRSRQGYDSAR